MILPTERPLQADAPVVIQKDLSCRG